MDKDIAADQTGKISGVLSDLRDRLTERRAAPAIEDSLSRMTGRPAVSAQARVPVTGIENLDRARKAFRDRVELPPINANAISKEQAAAVLPSLDTLAAKMEAASPDYVAGKQLYERITGKLSNRFADPRQDSLSAMIRSKGSTEFCSRHSRARIHPPECARQ